MFLMIYHQTLDMLNAHNTFRTTSNVFIRTTPVGKFISESLRPLSAPHGHSLGEVALYYCAPSTSF